MCFKNFTTYSESLVKETTWNNSFLISSSLIWSCKCASPPFRIVFNLLWGMRCLRLKCIIKSLLLWIVWSLNILNIFFLRIILLILIHLILLIIVSLPCVVLITPINSLNPITEFILIILIFPPILIRINIIYLCVLSTINPCGFSNCWIGCVLLIHIVITIRFWTIIPYVIYVKVFILYLVIFKWYFLCTFGI